MQQRNKPLKHSHLRAKRRAYRREEIINASIEVFAEAGYGSASMDDIARKLEATKGLVYHHFESKEEILDAILGDEKLVAQLEAAQFPPAGMSLTQAAWSAIDSWFAVMRSNAPLVRLLCQQSTLPAGKAEIAFRRFRERLYEGAARWLDHFKQSGEIRPEIDSRAWGRLAVDAAVNLFLQEQTSEDRPTQPPSMEAFMEILFNGVRTKRSGFARARYTARA